MKKTIFLTNLLCMLCLPLGLLVVACHSEQTHDKRPTVHYSYKILEVDHHSDMDNYSVLVATADNSSENLQQISQDIKHRLAGKTAKINLYDNEAGFRLEKEMRKEKSKIDAQFSARQITPAQYHFLTNLISRKYYLAIAHHATGSLDTNNKFAYYPYRSGTKGFQSIVYLSEY